MPAPATDAPSASPPREAPGSQILEPTAGGGPRYCTFVQPEHPLLDAIFPPAPERGEDALGDALAALRRHCAYRSRPGRRSFDELLAASRASEGRLEINCVDLICLLVSQLRAAGVGDDRAFVALAGIRGFLQHHAWALVRQDKRFLWIDPAVLEPVVRPGREILDHHDLYVVFNDRRLLFGAEEKRRLLTGDWP